MDQIDFYEDYKNYGEENYLRQKVGIKSRNNHSGLIKSHKASNSIYRLYRGINNAEFKKFKTVANNAEDKSSDYISPGFRDPYCWVCGICGSPKCV